MAIDGLFFLSVGSRALYEIIRLWRPSSKAHLIYKLQQRGLHPSTPTDHKPAFLNAIPHSSPLTPTINGIDIALVLATISLTISLIVLQHVAWQRGEYGVVLFVLFSSQFNDIAQYLCGKWLKNKLFKRILHPPLALTKVLKVPYLVDSLLPYLLRYLGFGWRHLMAGYALLLLMGWL